MEKLLRIGTSFVYMGKQRDIKRISNHTRSRTPLRVDSVSSSRPVDKGWVDNGGVIWYENDFAKLVEAGMIINIKPGEIIQEPRIKLKFGK